MSTYLIGDIHGCYVEFKKLLKKISFNIYKDKLWLTGDLIYRGPDSFKVLKYIYKIRNNVKLSLGNHDITFLLNFYSYKNNIEELNIKNYEKNIFKKKNINSIVKWLRNQPLAHINHKKKIIMCHAGIYPKWNFEDIINFSLEVEQFLKKEKYLHIFLKKIKGNYPDLWSDNLVNFDRIRFIVNSFTRMRYCSLNGKLNFKYKILKKNINNKLHPWFDILLCPIIKSYNIFFGHWSDLRGKGTPKNIIGLDTGCCWGHCLTAYNFEKKIFFSQKCKSI
ncbi:symmetrical bis(5'-nucleosyl)-tetraphosphatase [Buchnera aphidicola (Taiwanaphis decaspermi)]|uniref:symmetrical bis(5'-nucleosyl)-tetraphosphatase n=1 Tax=Buchnera aphidicola TaxID=9 RepID=UPI0031B86EFC